jgi:hypothetical protein
MLGFQHLGHYPNKFQHTCSRDFDLGGGFQHQDVTQSFNMVVREILTLGEAFKVSTLRSLHVPYRLQASMAYIAWCFNMVFLRGAFTPNSPQERPRLSLMP